MKKVIVTGGAGFIGSNLVDRLCDMGIQVSIIDNFSTGKREYINPAAYCWEQDIATVSIDDLVNFMKGVDVVFHMAAEPRIQISINKPVETINTNIIGTANILEAAKLAGVNRVIFSSTCAAYGLINKIPFTETMKTDCLNTYSISKVAGEELCKMYSEVFELDTMVFRYFNVYGNRQPTTGQYAPVIGIFKRQNENNESLTIVGDGLQTRDYINVNDIVEANIAGANSKLKSIGSIYNIGTGKEYSVLDIAKMISDDYIHIPERVGECRYVRANIDKAKQALSWKPKIELEKWIKI
jgi:UDP-glucose 4-epimerase